ncbi:MAG: type IV toxin-antitoxin system AbiEi family antitoxin [Coriobacteriia bacterium]|nr:type IV toxin-antitoxin system AbiEi family antitoxin [Coriobacteriia bacterium]
MTVRDITSTLAPLLELLELEQPRVVTTAGLRTMAADAGIDWPVDLVVRRLRQRGWLLDLQTRGAWEFAPAARAGALGAGDPMIELRAALKKNPDAPLAVGAESAAYRLGLSSRRPDREVVAAPKEIRLPKALREFRIARWTTQHVVRKDDLPVWTIAPLLAFMASQPASYHDWPNVGEWIAAAASDVSLDDLREELSGRPRAAWARAAYLLDRGGQADFASKLLAGAPDGRGPYYMGNRKASGRYFKEYDLIDTTGMEVGKE